MLAGRAVVIRERSAYLCGERAFLRIPSRAEGAARHGKPPGIHLGKYKKEIKTRRPVYWARCVYSSAPWIVRRTDQLERGETSGLRPREAIARPLPFRTARGRWAWMRGNEFGTPDFLAWYGENGVVV